MKHAASRHHVAAIAAVVDEWSEHHTAGCATLRDEDCTCWVTDVQAVLGDPEPYLDDLHEEAWQQAFRYAATQAPAALFDPAATIEWLTTLTVSVDDVDPVEETEPFALHVAVATLLATDTPEASKEDLRRRLREALTDASWYLERARAAERARVAATIERGLGSFVERLAALPDGHPRRARIEGIVEGLAMAAKAAAAPAQVPARPVPYPVMPPLAAVS